MADDKEIKHAIEEAVSNAVTRKLAELRESLTGEIVEKVAASVRPLLAKSAEQNKKEEPAPGTGPTDILNAAAASIYDANGQADILKALLEGISQFSARAALFVLKGANLAAWQARGFANESAIKGFTLSASSGLAGRAIRDKEPVSAAAAEFDSGFVSTHGNPTDGNAAVFPIVVRDKVAAVVYVDAGTEADGASDQSAVRILVRSAASWLELISLRKAGGSEPAVAEMPVPPASAAEASAPPVALEPAPEPPQAAPTPPPAAEPIAPAAAGDVSGLSDADQEVHKKAKRFAKLLVDEIKLYNQAKVAEGRQNKDLYSRLKEDIDKSRATYEKRYGSTAAGSAKYFHAEVVRILAENDVSVLGGDFTQ